MRVIDSSGENHSIIHNQSSPHHHTSFTIYLETGMGYLWGNIYSTDWI